MGGWQTGRPNKRGCRYIYTIEATPPQPTTTTHQPNKKKRKPIHPSRSTPTHQPLEKQNQDGWELDIKEDVEDECGRYGAVKHVFVDVKTPGGMVYVLFGEEPVGVFVGGWVGGRAGGWVGGGCYLCNGWMDGWVDW